MQADKKNMERMAEVVPESDDQVLQNFLTHSSWDHRAVMDEVAKKTNSIVGCDKDSALYIDESCFQKKGKKSAGVARQWNGRLGKKENSQVGVFGALGKGDRVGLIDARLYLPQEWTDDTSRCDDAGIPRENQTHKTKIELALDIVQHARSLGLRFNWIGMDALYGRSFELLQTLDNMEEVFVADIDENRHIYLNNPSPYLPLKDSVRGRKHTIYRSDESALEVRKWAKQQPDWAWKKKTLRHSTKGKLVVEILHHHVWLWDKKSKEAKCWHLIARREVNSPGTIKYSLCNAPEDVSVLRLAKMQAQRFWIERAFQDAKSHVGMAQYQARKWQSWHRHISLVMLALQFMLETRMDNKDEHPLLSCYDIQVLLATMLPTRRNSQEEILRQMKVRHKKRQMAINSANECPD